MCLFQFWFPRCVCQAVELLGRMAVLIDRVPDELWNEVHDIVQETGIKTIPMEKKCKKAKWLSGEALQIAVKRREAKDKGEKERHTHLNDNFSLYACRMYKNFYFQQRVNIICVSDVDGFFSFWTGRNGN